MPSSVHFLNYVISGFPSTDDNYDYYKDQEYRDDDYDDNYEDSPVNDVDGDSDNAIAIHRPVIISESTNIEVDNEMTIRLPCLVDKLPSKYHIVLCVWHYVLIGTLSLFQVISKSFGVEKTQKRKRR